MEAEVKAYYKRRVKELEAEREILMYMFQSGRYGMTQRQFITEMQKYTSQIERYNKKLRNPIPSID